MQRSNLKPRVFAPWFGVAMVAALLFAASCGGSTSTSSGTTPHQGGSLVIARTEATATLDPTATFDNESIWVLEQIYNSLYTVNKAGTGVIPSLATSYTLSQNQLTWTFTLRSGVKFSNGHTMTSADVKFSLDRARKSTEGLGYLDAAISSIDAPNPSTVVIHTSDPWAPLLADISLFTNSIIPANFGGETEQRFFQSPVGTGPFKLSSWQPGGSLTVVRNPYYWQPGLPYLNKVTWTVVPDANTRVLQLEGNQAQIDEFPPYQSVATLAQTAGVTAEAFPSTEIYFLIMNEKEAPFNDIHVRQAISYAVDRQALVNSVLFGHGATSNSLFPPTLAFYDPDAQVPQYDLAKAKQEMAQSSVPNGFSATFLTSTDPTFTTIAQVVQQDLAAIGIHLTITTVDPTTIWTMQGDFQYQMSMGLWTMDIPDPDELVEFFYNSNGGSSCDYTNYQNTQMNSMVTDAASVFGAAQRQKLYSAIQVQGAQDLPNVPLLHAALAYGFSTKVHGFFVYPLGNYHLENVWLSN
jgi:peptide/nickel transport system substrate-binding protein